MLGRQAPMFVSLYLIAESSMARVTPDVFGSDGEVFLQLCPCSEAEKTCKANKVMAGNGEVVFEMILETPSVFESTQAQVAGNVVPRRMVNVVLEPVSIDKDTLAKIAVVLVPLR